MLHGAAEAYVRPFASAAADCCATSANKSSSGDEGFHYPLVKLISSSPSASLSLSLPLSREETFFFRDKERERERMQLHWPCASCPFFSLPCFPPIRPLPPLCTVICPGQDNYARRRSLICWYPRAKIESARARVIEADCCNRRAPVRSHLLIRS